MPELPEVECVRRGLTRANLSGKIIEEVWRSEFDLRTGAFWREEGLHRLEGARTGTFERRGKFLLWRMRSAKGEPITAVIHLGMTGQLRVSSEAHASIPHTHLIVGLRGGPSLCYSDARRFGGVHVGTEPELARVGPLASLGPEPLDPGFEASVLEERGGSSKRAIRDVLLDQGVVAGLGNIYVSEALFRAGINPLALAYELQTSAWTRLADAIGEVLRQGIRNGGTTLRDYRDSTGNPGRNKASLQVYGRGGQGCPSCGTTLHAYTHGGRSGVMCKRCQPARRRR